MKQACCQWCLAPMQVQDDYNRFKHKAYCSVHCLQKDWLFMQWQSDKNLNRIAKDYMKGGDDASSTE